MGGPGALLNGSKPGSQITGLLQRDADQYQWVTAAVGSNSASGYQLASGEAVMPIGGFNGSDPSPTLAQFLADVSAEKIHYFIARDFGARGWSMGGSNVSSQISSWVRAHFTAKTVDGVTVYDLAQPTTSG